MLVVVFCCSLVKLVLLSEDVVWISLIVDWRGRKKETRLMCNEITGLDLFPADEPALLIATSPTAGNGLQHERSKHNTQH
jgi:hypothetical protein